MLPDDDPRHGTTGGYTNHLCRCPACRKANTEYIRRYRTTERGRERTRIANAATAMRWLRRNHPEVFAAICDDVA